VNPHLVIFGDKSLHWFVGILFFGLNFHKALKYDLLHAVFTGIIWRTANGVFIRTKKLKDAYGLKIYFLLLIG
jgi:hypothetical protein